MLHAQPRIAISHFQRAIASQSHYRNLHHISLWEVAIARMALWELGDVVRHDEERSNDSGQKAMGGSSACWRILEQEANWSKAIYSYGLAVCLLEDWENDEDPPQGKTKKEERMKEAAELMAHVPRLCQKIVGKSIPFEKFVARKALKFTSQKCRLLLPALEMAYMLNALAHTPRMVVAKRMLPLVQEALGRLAMYASGTWTETSSSNISAVDLGTQVNEGFRLNAYEGGPAEYWDDLCLARFLHGDPDAVLEDKEDLVILQEDAARGAEDSFRAVFEHGPKIHFDHYLVYYARNNCQSIVLFSYMLTPFSILEDYEFGRLLTFKHKFEEAKHEFELILSGKHLEVGPSGRKGRYSMENALHMRAQAALKAME
ncbi:hypothetical protein H0H81_001836 [Sphagnurus paluster]|uniref:Uncharacterized protein n=1 Tax=Sphagnurus paluster TaxID=117069 RepID=A0A9P7K439_9AGAR|nr:hypothetical protein H0H81_001836 [Sphagnurus paluster]